MPIHEERVFIGLDVETTNARGGICELAAVAIGADGAELGAFERLVQPGNDGWDPRVCAVHGITQSDVMGSPVLSALWFDFIQWLRRWPEGTQVWAHNAAFEHRVLMADVGPDPLEFELVCSLKLARRRVPSLPSHRLSVVCAALGVPLIDAHRAGPDARAAAHVVRLLHMPRPPVDLAAANKAMDPGAAGGTLCDEGNAWEVDAWTSNEQRGCNAEIRSSTSASGQAFQGEVVCLTGKFGCGRPR